MRIWFPFFWGLKGGGVTSLVFVSLCYCLFVCFRYLGSYLQSLMITCRCQMPLRPGHTICTDSLTHTHTHTHRTHTWHDNEDTKRYGLREIKKTCRTGFF